MTPSVGQQLKTAREVAGLTQPDVETETGITRSVLSRIERDLRSPTPDEMHALATCYACPPLVPDPPGKINWFVVGVFVALAAGLVLGAVLS